MRRFIMALLLGTLITTPGCAFVQKVVGVNGSPTSPASLLAYVSDIRWSLVAAHNANWLTDADFKLGNDALDAASAAIQKNLDGAQYSIQQVLKDLVVKLPADSRLLPYFDWFIKALGGNVTGTAGVRSIVWGQ